jgi:hypothetical protein
LLDIAVGDSASSQLTILLADGHASPIALAAHDFDGDGHIDLAVALAANTTIAMMYGDGTGGFTARGSGR